MIPDILLALGLAAVLEGLAIALAPRHLEDALRRLCALTPEAKRTIGLTIVGLGVTVVWLARSLE